MCKSWSSHANKPVNMIIYIWQKKVTSSLASIKGQDTEHTTVKWPIKLSNVSGEQFKPYKNEWASGKALHFLFPLMWIT